MFYEIHLKDKKYIFKSPPGDQSNLPDIFKRNKYHFTTINGKDYWSLDILRFFKFTGIEESDEKNITFYKNGEKYKQIFSDGEAYSYSNGIRTRIS